MGKEILKYLIPAVSSIFLVNTTLAADQSSTVKKNISITKPNDNTDHQVELFNGFYFGISGNYASQTDTSTCYTTYDCNAWNFNSTTLQKPQGYFGSFDVGYNYRFQNNFLIGSEINISTSNVNDKNSQWSSVYSKYYNSSTNYYNLSTATFKVGYVIGKNLIYAKGGIGFSEISDTFTNTYSSGAIVNDPNGYLNNTSNIS
jgi:outer membrane immunogenic protein